MIITLSHICMYFFIPSFYIRQFSSYICIISLLVNGGWYNNVFCWLGVGLDLLKVKLDSVAFNLWQERLKHRWIRWAKVFFLKFLNDYPLPCILILWFLLDMVDIIFVIITTYKSCIHVLEMLFSKLYLVAVNFLCFVLARPVPVPSSQRLLSYLQPISRRVNCVRYIDYLLSRYYFECVLCNPATRSTKLRKCIDTNRLPLNLIILNAWCTKCYNPKSMFVKPEFWLLIPLYKSVVRMCGFGDLSLE